MHIVYANKIKGDSKMEHWAYWRALEGRLFLSERLFSFIKNRVEYLHGNPYRDAVRRVFNPDGKYKDIKAFFDK